MSMKVKVRDLKPGDYVVPANAIVAEVDLFAGCAIVDFTDSTATAPVPADSLIEIRRDPLN